MEIIAAAVILGAAIIAAAYIWKGRGSNGSSAPSASSRSLDPVDVHVSPPRPVLHSAAKPLVRSRGVPNSLELVSPEGSLVTFVPAKATPGGKLLPAGVAEKLSALLASAPSAALAANSLGTFRAVFSPEIAAQLADGTLSLVKSRAADGVRLIARNGAGKFAGQGTAVAVSALPALGLLAFQALSFAVGQAHMSRITKRLDGIDTKLSEVLARMDDEQRGKLRAAVRHLREIAESLQTDDIRPDEAHVYLSQIESAYREALQVYEAFEPRLSRHGLALQWLTINEGYQEDRKEFDRAQEELNMTAQTLHVALAVRSIALQTAAMLPNAPGSVERRSKQVQSESEALCGAVKQAVSKGLARAEEIREDGFWTDTEKTQAMKKSVRVSLARTGSEAASATAELSKHTESIRSQLYKRRVSAERGLTVELWRRKNGKWAAFAVPTQTGDTTD